MISRRLLRVKALQMLYVEHVNPDKSITGIEKDLFFSINKTHEMYHLLLQLFVETAKLVENKLDRESEKKYAAIDTSVIGKNFIKNKYMKFLNDNYRLKQFCTDCHFQWSEHEDFVKHIYNSLREQDFFKKYEEIENPSLKDDKKFLENFYLKLIAEDEEFYNFIEEKSIYWNDEPEFVISMIIKTIKSIKNLEENSFKLLPAFSDVDDKFFVSTLIKDSIRNKRELIETIKSYLKDWEIDRIPLTDVLILNLAMVEFKRFETIPIKATMNEYLEIAKHYSTDKSQIFINGILDRISKDFLEQKIIVKKGRGLA
ncbi:MAG: transcription antitermination factor NusB [Marinifilaceae bacterium]|jgi:N utilization substance protein B|nr:transcription antitermination factor NusB [Marinifilaceae bacterium]